MIQDIAPHKYDVEFKREAVPEENSCVCLFNDEKKICIRKDRDEDVLPRKKDFSGDMELTYLFRMDDTEYYLSNTPPADLSDDYEFISLRDYRTRFVADNARVFSAWTAYQLSNWYRDNTFCGTCGERTVLSEKERAVVCPACGRTIYPRIVPAVIIGVTNGEQLLMTRYNRPGAYHALVAGFMEIGESFEDTIRREVMEEVGLKVKNIRYYKSQPWAIVDDILAGFYCDVDGDTAITLDNQELKEGQWFNRDEIDSQPDNFSLTNEMMQTFKAGLEPKVTEK